MGVLPRSLRFKVQLAVLGMFVIALAIFWRGLHYVVVDSYQQVERTEAVEDVGRARAAVLASNDRLTSTSKDWATWTDTYEFVAGKRPGYPADNLSASVLKNLQVDFMIFHRADGKVIWITALDPRTGDSLQRTDGIKRAFEAASRQAKPAGSSDTNKGIILVDGVPALFASCAITDSKGTAPPDGTLVVGMYVGEMQTASARTITGLNVSFTRPVATGVTPATPPTDAGVDISYLGQNTIVGKTTLLGVDGRPALEVSISEPRMGWVRANQTLGTISWGVLGIVLTFGVVLGGTLEVTILRRLAHLHSYVKGDVAPGETARFRVGGADEISDLAVEFDRAAEARRSTEAQLRHQAEHDDLTGLANRRRLGEEMSKALAVAARESAQVALLMVDLNDFKLVNDEYGHSCGDDVLRWFADQLREVVREYCTVARIGGDEFAILLPHTGREGAHQVIGRLEARLSEPCDCSGAGLYLAASTGEAVYPEDGASAEELTIAADLSMYANKRARLASEA